MWKLKSGQRPDPTRVDLLSGLWKKSNRISEIPVTGNSMHPFLQNGDTLKVIHRTQKIYPGDIAVYFRSNRLIVHRVVKIKKGGTLLTKGDNLLFFDNPQVSGKEIIGVVSTVERKGRVINLRTWHGRVMARAVSSVSLLMGSYPGFFQHFLNLRKK